jgi:hypothetical protein
MTELALEVLLDAVHAQTGPKATVWERRRIEYALQTVAASRNGDLFNSRMLKAGLAAHINISRARLYEVLFEFPELLGSSAPARALFAAGLQNLKRRTRKKYRIPVTWVLAMRPDEPSCHR